MNNLNPFFKSITDQDNAPIVVCDAAHEIIYMNPAAVSAYEKRGGAALVGRSILDCHNENSRARIKQVAAWFASSPENNRVHTYYSEKQNKDVYMIALRDENGAFIGYYEKHEYRTKDETPAYVLD